VKVALTGFRVWDIRPTSGSTREPSAPIEVSTGVAIASIDGSTAAARGSSGAGERGSRQTAAPSLERRLVLAT
jgi:hypothetical protein